MRKENLISSVLIVCPTSLKYQWKKEIERFTGCQSVVIEGNHLRRKKMYDDSTFYKIVSYNSICNDVKILRHMSTDFMIMDEAQRLKKLEYTGCPGHATHSCRLHGSSLRNSS